MIPLRNSAKIASELLSKYVQKCWLKLLQEFLPSILAETSSTFPDGISAVIAIRSRPGIPGMFPAENA